VRQNWQRMSYTIITVFIQQPLHQPLYQWTDEDRQLCPPAVTFDRSCSGYIDILEPHFVSTTEAPSYWVHIVLSCAVFWFCAYLFGLVAMIIAGIVHMNLCKLAQTIWQDEIIIYCNTEGCSRPLNFVRRNCCYCTPKLYQPGVISFFRFQHNKLRK